MTDGKALIHRWETRGKRYWIEAFTDGSYRTNNGGGHRRTAAESVAHCSRMVTLLRDVDRINLKRVAP